MILARGLTKRRGDRIVLDSLDLEIGDEHRIVVLVGPSGSGKTTFLRCLAGFDDFDGGTLQVGEHRLGEVALSRLRRDVGFVFQGLHLFPHLTVLENLRLAPRLVLQESASSSETRALSLLAQLGLQGKAFERPAALSGGERQRAAIARALMMRPSVLLFDEPTSALDPIRVHEMGTLMKDLAARGVRIVVVTHSMGLARALGGQLVVLDAGRVVESGPSATVLADPQHPISRTFFGS